MSSYREHLKRRREQLRAGRRTIAIELDEVANTILLHRVIVDAAGKVLQIMGPADLVELDVETRAYVKEMQRTLDERGEDLHAVADAGGSFEDFIAALSPEQQAEIAAYRAEQPAAYERIRRQAERP